MGYLVHYFYDVFDSAGDVFFADFVVRILDKVQLVTFHGSEALLKAVFDHFGNSQERRLN